LRYASNRGRGQPTMRSPDAAHRICSPRQGAALAEDLRLELRREAGGRLYVRVGGSASLDNTLAYWRMIVDAVRAQPARELLLVDELVGPSLGEDDWRRLVAEVGEHLGDLRIAHVLPRGPDTVEYCVLHAIGAGLQAQVFSDPMTASI